MILCPACQRENEEHYKFCLGCGAELAAPSKPEREEKGLKGSGLGAGGLGTGGLGAGGLGAGGLPPMRGLGLPPLSAVQGFSLGAPKPLEGSGLSAIGASPFSAPSSAPPPAAEPAAEEPIAELSEADLFDEDDREEATQIVRRRSIGRTDGPMADPAVPARLSAQQAPISAPPSLSSPPTSAPLPLPSSGEKRVCGTCGNFVPEAFRFCGTCGTRFEAEGAAPSLVSGADTQSAHLVLIYPDGSPGEAFPLSMGETIVGRHHEHPLFYNDPYLSPRHAIFYFVRGQLFVRDEGSLNGIFIRIKADVELFHRDMFRIGQQLLRFEAIDQVRSTLGGTGDGTTVLGSPIRGAWGRLCLLSGIDSTADIWILRRPEEQLGRERGEIRFPEDGFVSGSHCKLMLREGRFFLRDIGSTNGTYLRIKGEGYLTQGDLVLLGQQLFRIELGGAP